jgi:Zn-dependent alcohol dehydrogenase
MTEAEMSYKHGDLELDELIRTRRKLERINEGHVVTHRGDNLRAVIVHDTGSSA